MCSKSVTCITTALKLLEKKQQNIEQSIDYQILQETGQKARGMQKLSHQSDQVIDPLLQSREKVKHTIFGFGNLESEQNIFPTTTMLVFLQTIVLFNFDCSANCLKWSNRSRQKNMKIISKFFYFVQFWKHLIFFGTKEYFRKTSPKSLKRLSCSQLKLNNIFPKRTKSTNNLLWFQHLSETDKRVPMHCQCVSDQQFFGHIRLKSNTQISLARDTASNME